MRRLAVAKGCPGFKKPLYITDQDTMLNLMHKNITLNSLDDVIQAVVYNWGEDLPVEVLAAPDIVLAADCVYFEPAFPFLYQTLKDLIGDATICFFCFKKRRRADLTFIKTLKKSFEVRTIEDDPDKDIYGRESIFL